MFNEPNEAALLKKWFAHMREVQPQRAQHAQQQHRRRLELQHEACLPFCNTVLQPYPSAFLRAVL